MKEAILVKYLVGEVLILTVISKTPLIRLQLIIIELMQASYVIGYIISHL